MCFPTSPWAANCPLLSNLAPVCSLTPWSLSSSSLLISLTACSHGVVVCSELRAKVTQMLGVEIQPGIRDRAEPSQGSLARLKFETASPHLHRNDIEYGLDIIWLLISLSAIKKIRMFPTFIYFLRHAHSWCVASFTLRWHLQRFSAQFSWQEPRCCFWAVDGLERQDQIWWLGFFMCKVREHLGRNAHVYHQKHLRYVFFQIFFSLKDLSALLSPEDKWNERIYKSTEWQDKGGWLQTEREEI